MKIKPQYSYWLFLCSLFLLSGSCSALIRPTLYNATPFTIDVVVSFVSTKKQEPFTYQLLSRGSTVIERPTYTDFYNNTGNASIASIKATVPAIQEPVVGSGGIKTKRREKTVERTDLEPSAGGNFERAYLGSMDKPGNFAVISTGALVYTQGANGHMEGQIADLRIHRFIQ